MTDQLKVQVSAFLDDELLDEECELFVRRLCSDDKLRETAGRYAMIGDVVRGESFLRLQELGKKIHTELNDDQSDLQQKSALAELPVTARRHSGFERFIKPIGGVAVAATVAMAAVFLVQSPTEVDLGELPSTTVARVDTENSPGPQLQPVGLPRIKSASVSIPTQMDHYLLQHKNYATGFGNPSILGFRDIGVPYEKPQSDKNESEGKEPLATESQQ